MDESPTKADGGSARHHAGYKSWKKKYRKMRIVFDHKMHDGEELHKQEDKAASLVKRLAIENDRLLDLLLEVNNSPQIPPERQIDVALVPAADSEALVLSIDVDQATRKAAAAKKLQDLLAGVPHSSYSQAKDVLPTLVEDLKAPEGEAHPTDFLSGDDIDNYIYEADATLEPETHLPSLAPLAHPENRTPTNPHLKNPTSVTNWLRKHAPKIFLQDGESHGADPEDAEGGGHTGGRKTRGARGERGGRASTRGKRASAAARVSAAAERGADSMDEDADFAVTPVGRGKRKRDDDTGYKPRGSSTRPTKKKRKSEAADGTPTVRKSKKEAAAAAAMAAAAGSHDE